MIKIYGLKVSNFSSMVRFSLMEKNIDFEWIETYPYSMSGDKSILEKDQKNEARYTEKRNALNGKLEAQEAEKANIEISLYQGVFNPIL